MKKNKTKKHVPLLLWLIPVMTVSVTLISFLGVGFAAVLQWMRTMKLQRKATQLYIDRTTAQIKAEEQAEQ